MDTLIFVYLVILFTFLSALAAYNLFYFLEMNKVSRDLNIVIHGIIPYFYKLTIATNIISCIFVLIFLIYAAIKI